jgi:hypothetical protein
VRREVRTFKTTTKELLALPAWLAAEQCTPHAGHHRVLVPIQTGAIGIQNVHVIVSRRCATGMGSRSKNSRNRAPGPSPARRAIRGAPKIPGPTKARALPHQENTDLCAGSGPTIPRRRPSRPFHSQRVGNTGAGLKPLSQQHRRAVSHIGVRDARDVPHPAASLASDRTAPHATKPRPISCGSWSIPPPIG